MSFLLALASALVGAPGAFGQSGAHFTYELCDPGIFGGNPPAVEFTPSAGELLVPVYTCSTPGGGIALQEINSETYGSAHIQVSVPATPGGYVEGETISASSSLRPGDEGREVSGVLEGGWPFPNAGEFRRYFPFRKAADPSGENGGNFWITLGCSAAACGGGSTIGAHYISVDEVDPNPPVVGNLTGTLIEGGTRRGHQTLTAEATDLGGGVSVVEARVNGVPVPESVRPECFALPVSNFSYRGIAATKPTPCPAAVSSAWNLDTAAAPFQEGENTVQVCGSDFATSGLPNTTCSSPVSVEVDDSCPESGPGTGEELSVGFVASGSEQITVGFGEEAPVRGRLTDSAGRPVAGASICIRAQTAESGEAPRPLATPVTDPNGQFEYAVPAGPNRQITFGYRHDSLQIGRTLTLGTHAGPTLHVSASRVRNGDRVEITGTLPAPNPGGHVLVLQASGLHSDHWLTFRRVTTGPNGGYQATYRFARTTRKTTYRLRAFEPRQQGDSYEPGASDPVRINVRPKSSHGSPLPRHSGRRHPRHHRRTRASGDRDKKPARSRR